MLHFRGRGIVAYVAGYIGPRDAPGVVDQERTAKAALISSPLSDSVTCQTCPDAPSKGSKIDYLAEIRLNEAKFSVEILIRVTKVKVRRLVILFVSLRLIRLRHGDEGKIQFRMWAKLRHLFGAKHSPKVAQKHQNERRMFIEFAQRNDFAVVGTDVHLRSGH